MQTSKHWREIGVGRNARKGVDSRHGMVLNEGMETETYYPSRDEVNELLELAEGKFGGTEEYRRLIFAASGCKAEAVAFANLRAVAA